MNTFSQKLKKKFLKLPFSLVLVGVVFVIVLIMMVVYVYKQGVQSKAAGDSVTLSYSTPTVSAGSGGTFATTIKVQPNGDITARGYFFTVNFDKTKLQLKDMSYQLGSVSTGLGQDNSMIAAINAAGSIKVQADLQDTTGKIIYADQLTNVIWLSFVSNTASPTSISIDTNKTGFYKINSDYTLSLLPITTTDLSVNPSSTGITPSTSPGNVTNTPTLPTTITPTCVPIPTCGPTMINCQLPPEPSSGWCASTTTPSLTPSPTNVPSTTASSGNVALDLKLKFQGITHKPDDKFNKFLVNVIAEAGDGTTTVGGATFTADSSGTWSGSVPLTLTPGDGYKIFVKGPKHLQKRICDMTPTETAPGTYNCENGNITLKDGVNNLDFSGIYQLVGDLPEQDGVVDSYDISLVINNFGKTDLATLSVADLNLDGVIDTQDYSLIIAALSQRSDEGP